MLFLVLSVFVSFFPSFSRSSLPADVFRKTAPCLLIAETCLAAECRQCSAPCGHLKFRVRPRQGNNKGLKGKQKAATESAVTV